MVRHGRGILWFVLAVVFAVGLQRTSPSQDLGNVAPGRVEVVDGDTLSLEGRLIQLHGIDAPELGQTCYHDGIEQLCGVIAARALHKLVNMTQGPLRCVPVGTYLQMETMTCWAGHWDLARVLVADGYALAAPHGPSAYVEQESEAREARLGLWSGDFMLPWEWRPDADGGTGARRDCNVKAVVGKDGARRFYVPLDEAYDGIALDRKHGDRLFCSDEAALQAGWSRP